MVLAAFAIDFGNAYSQRRALSSGADSAALSIAAMQQQIGVAKPGKS
jgi:Flp pilus assembly protein TadG